MPTMPETRITSHGLALGLLGAVLALWLVALAVTLEVAGHEARRSGTLLAVFPRGIGATEVLARVAGADGVVIGGTWFGNVWHVHGERPRFAGELREQGAVYVLPTLPFSMFGTGGCGFGESLRSPARPATSGI
jgi:hypothetical protein